MDMQTTARSERSGGTPRVLTVLPDFPFPAITGLHLRHLSNLDLVHRLGCYSALLYFTTEERDPTPQQAQNRPLLGAPEPPLKSTPLARICDEVHHGGKRFPHANFSTASLIARKLDFLARGALSLPGKYYPFSMSYDRIGAQEIVLDHAQRVQADFVVLASMFMHYSAALRQHGFKTIIDAADVLTNLSASFMANLRGRAGRIGLLANYLACRSQERIFLRKCSELWATSDAEAEQFRRFAPGVRVLVVPNCLDEAAIRPAAAPMKPVIGFIGTYSYTPNLTAALFLAEQVFPRVAHSVPDAVLRLAGANMPPAERARLSALPGVELLGRVEDSGAFVNECAVLALPVFLRGGVPLKLIEAMARGKAIVATPELVAGLDLVDRREVMVRGNPEDFAAAIVSLLEDRHAREQLGANARACFARDFSISSVESRLRRDSVLMARRADVARDTDTALV